ncbi:hypothetical protein [Piscinibacter sp. HJYY11]|uniref:hypothetical protein n=1 Tax=Piscinibacter sp. HJYY11 TaxID=2801333 RepID=UPI00191DD7E1|nr:hypothetical protein [Piscinibacter sp. HJYY11]MBL0729603.1 hypothetical protein [Piscinibacter sp. HJYY11]
MTVREVAIELRCSMHVAGTLLARSHDQRIDKSSSDWLNGLPHRTARALLTLGFKSQKDVSEALVNGTLNSDTPGMGQKTITAIEEWLGSRTDSEQSGGGMQGIGPAAGSAAAATPR